MSHTTVIAVWPGDRAEEYEELRNSHGCAPVIWGAMAEQYLGGRSNWLWKSEELWKLYKREDMQHCMRAVYFMTCDNAYIEKKDYARAAADIREFLRQFPPPGQHINHWPRIAETFESNPDVPAFGLRCTSVAENPWSGEWNDETEEYGPVDWKKAWSVYDEPIILAEASK